jgi:hypothetical protein
LLWWTSVSAFGKSSISLLFVLTLRGPKRSFLFIEFVERPA